MISHESPSDTNGTVESWVKWVKMSHMSDRVTSNESHRESWVKWVTWVTWVADSTNAVAPWVMSQHEVIKITSRVTQVSRTVRMSQMIKMRHESSSDSIMSRTVSHESNESKMSQMSRKEWHQWSHRVMSQMRKGVTSRRRTMGRIVNESVAKPRTPPTRVESGSTDEFKPSSGWCNCIRVRNIEVKLSYQKTTWEICP